MVLTHPHGFSSLHACRLLSVAYLTTPRVICLCGPLACVTALGATECTHAIRSYPSVIMREAIATHEGGTWLKCCIVGYMLVRAVLLF